MKYFKLQSVSVLFFIALLVAGCGQNKYQLDNTTSNYLSLDSSVGINGEAESYIKPYRDSLDAEMKRSIGIAKQELGGGIPESLLSNFVADLLLEECQNQTDWAKPDICIINVKGLRIPIGKGDITVENIYQLMPFENELVYLTLSKQQVIDLFNFMASVGGDGMSGASFAIKNKEAQNIKVGKQALQDRDYIVATSDYLADGGDHFQIFQSASKRAGTGLKVRDAIILHIEKLSAQNKQVNSELDNRIYYAE
ncbi:MAG: 5'-nucleotidase C-terminal domain-containing protein [Carboxylicivirga sp.]|jgi:2',3'-cyclic-nucleotide 2'-phosphodiesterase (5'-nucleotidase family)|nr:5'-nucleotidase C-terminal domain-containing protein [Carboxylicivirga sp.]MCT4647458.1 5'-nucleotidase C-terminal domain-containing protein [Carboxylicivirga sp.]